MSATLSMCQRTIACRPWASMSSSSFLITGCLQRAGKPLEQAVLLGGTSSSLFMHALCLLSDYGSDLLASSSLILSAFGMPNYMKLSRMFIFCLLAAPPWRLTGSPSLSLQPIGHTYPVWIWFQYPHCRSRWGDLWLWCHPCTGSDWWSLYSISISSFRAGYWGIGFLVAKCSGRAV